MSDLETQEPIETQEPQDIRDVVAREFDKLETNESKYDSAPKRDKSGKFQAKEAPAEPAEEVSQEPAETKTTEEKVAEEKVTEEPKRNPFAAWKKEAQTALSGLPPETQQFIIEREQQFHKGIQQYKTDAIKGRTLGAALAPYEEYLNQLQVTPEVAISKLLETEKMLRTSDLETRKQAFMKLAHDYGINPQDLTTVAFDPYRYQLEQQLAAQQAALERISSSRQMEEEAYLGQTIEQFAQSHEHFEEVRETMADLLDKGFATDLKDAYDKAVRLNDGLVAKPLQVDPVQKANIAAKAAKASAVSVKGAPTGVNIPPEPKTTEDAVRQAMAQLGL